MVCIINEDINSFISAYVVSKKGIRSILLYFDTVSDVSPKTYEYIKKNADKLFDTMPDTIKAFYVVSFQKVMGEINEKCIKEFVPIIVQRMEYRCYTTLYKRIGGTAIVVGDIIETADTISRFILEEEVSSFPIFRPLIGFEAQMIEKLRDEIGLYSFETISEPTHGIKDSSFDLLREEEKKLQVSALLTYAINTIKQIR